MKTLIVFILFFLYISCIAQQHVYTPAHDTVTFEKPKDSVAYIRTYKLHYSYWDKLFNWPPDTLNMRYTYKIVHDTIIDATVLNAGILEQTTSSIEDKIAILKLLKVQYVRMSITLSADEDLSWYYKYQQAGIKVIPTIVWDKPYISHKKFCTNIELYKTKLRQLLLKIYPEAFFVENEPLNSNIWDTTKANPLSNYFMEVNAACEVAHALGIKVIDGGVTFNKTNAFQVRYNMYLNLDAATQADYINIHWYFNSTDKNVFNFLTQVNYISTITGKPVVSGENGMFEDNVPLLKESQEAMKDFKYKIYCNGTGNDNRQIEPLYNKGLTELGVNFQK